MFSHYFNCILLYFNCILIYFNCILIVKFLLFLLYCLFEDTRLTPRYFVSVEGPVLIWDSHQGTDHGNRFSTGWTRQRAGHVTPVELGTSFPFVPLRFPQRSRCLVLNDGAEQEETGR